MTSAFCLSPVNKFISPAAYWNLHDEKHKVRWRKYAEIPIGGGKKVVVDFGKEIGGYLKIHWGKVKGGSVRFYFSECLEELEPAGDVAWEPLFSRMRPLCQHIYHGEGDTWWKASPLRGGFRYLLIIPDRGVTAEIRDIVIEADFYIPENGRYPGFFESSDEDLNRIWYAAAYTMQAATKHSYESFVQGKDSAGKGEWVLFDGAKRDRVVWAHDLALSIPSYLYSLWNKDALRDSLLTLLSQKGRGCFSLKRGYIPHSAFPENSLVWLAGTFSTFSVYVMWWVRGVYFYYLHTNDKEFVKNVFTDIAEGLKWLETQTRKSPESKTPLFFANGLNDLSWDYTILRFGFSGATNIVWAKTYEEAAWLAKNVMKNAALAEHYAGRARAIRKAVFEKGFKPYNLWDERLGRFRHTTMEEKPFTQEVNAQAVLYDFVNEDAAHKLLDLMAKRLHVSWGSLSSDSRFPFALSGRHNHKVMPSLVAYEVAALMKMNRMDEALDLTKKTWLPMLERGTGTTFWEWYGAHGKHAGAFASLCHPWSAWILQALTENLTGIKPARGGFSLFELNPSALAHAREINFLRFRIPTPKGLIRGEWHRAQKGIAYKVHLPEGIKGILSPLANSVVCYDGRGKKISVGGSLQKKVELRMKA